MYYTTQKEDPQQQDIIQRMYRKKLFIIIKIQFQQVDKIQSELYKLFDYIQRKSISTAYKCNLIGLADAIIYYVAFVYLNIMRVNLCLYLIENFYTYKQ